MHMYTHHCTPLIDPMFPHVPPKHFPSHQRITRKMFHLRRSDSKRKEFISSPWWASSFDLLDNHCIWWPSGLKMASQEKLLRLSTGRSVIFNRNPFHLGASGKQARSAELVLQSQPVLSPRNVAFGKQTSITYLPGLIHLQHGCQGKTG